ncbi:MAG: NACHT domain-containing protein [Candidatus Poribacteria bacterium]|nr:NACHT domain-containing protein [Candidatus Poribacteria bacterium]
MMAKLKKYTKAWVPPESYIAPPVRERAQTLPVNKLSWESFQRLCVRLAQRYGNVERCQEYGIPGQDQEGIDIYVRKVESSKYSVWQCKRYQQFRPTLIKKAVSDFLDGSWASKTDEFILAVTVKTEVTNLADAIEAQADRLCNQNIQFRPLGITQISQLLKDHPDLVDDFFGREWGRIFCGEEAVDKLSGRRLKPEDVIRLRQLLRHCYTQHFEITDPGLPSLTGSINSDFQPLSLVDRFVPPEILEEQQVSHTPEILEEQQVSRTEMINYSLEGQDNQRPHTDVTTDDSSSPRRTRVIPRPSVVRRSAIDWLSDSDRSVIIGDPGIGKSTLLRCILLDLLSPEPRYEIFARHWGQYLPVWVPFAMWTRLVGESETECSLSDVLTTWLRKVSAGEDLITLVQQALEDSRLLLFVDGLDEWSDETAARTALTLLEQFVGERNVPAIASSRPLGYERIGGLSSRWRKARLAGLTSEQQRVLAERWFLHRSNAFASQDEDADSIAMRETRAKAEAAEHIQDLHRDVRLSRLAEVPLLLNGLIALAIQRIHLPRSRFKAYDELTRLLLEEQPKRREKAAYARGTTTGRLSEENRKRALARLAWETHDSPGSDALNKIVAQNALQDFCSTHLYKNDAEALEIAEELLGIGAEAIGILVEKSSVDIGFLHRSFQEFLAAKHLSNLPFEQQKEFVKNHFENPQWHDVFLCLCHLNTREGEVDDFVDIVENIELLPEMELSRQSFLTEVAFGDLHCSASIARRLAEDTFEIIETGVHERTRERLLELALDGLESDALRPLVESRIQRWYPLRHPYRRGFYEAVATWPKNDEMQEILWRGLLDEEDGNRRAAAESLAKVFGEAPSIGEHLFELLFRPAEPRLLACALHALCLGWGTDHRLTAILNDSRLSTDYALQSVALIHRVKRNEHDMKDRKILINLSQKHSSDSWCWREDRIRALIAGWPDDLEVKREAIRSVTQQYPNKGVFDWDDAGIILLEGFPQDDEVAEVIAQLFQTEDYPQHSLGLHFNWGHLVKAFAGHQNLGLAVDGWIARKDFDRLFGDFELCLISRSMRAKGYLLKANDETGVITEYQARWLLQGWGMQDKEAATALMEFAKSDVAKRAADLLPDIFFDKELCRQRLLEMLREESESIGRYALMGLTKLGANEPDEEVVAAAISKYVRKVPSGAVFWGISDLIEHFPNHPKVRELALYQLHNREGDLNTVARAYSSKDEIRREILELCSSFPAHLRLIVVDRLARLGSEDEFAHRLLSKYDEDIDMNVKTLGAIGYAASVKRRGNVPSELLDKLNKRLLVIGPDHRERRQAAFSALLELDRLDIAKNAWSGDEMRNMDFGKALQTNLRLAAHLTRHWDQVSKTFSESFLEQVGWVPDEFLTEMAAYTTDPDLLDKIIDRLTGGRQERPTASSLRICARQWRGTPRLRELCLTLVRDFHISSWVQTAPGIVAAEILAEQFANDTETFSKLESLVTQGKISSALVIALSVGWPDSQAWKQLSEQVEMPRLLFPAGFYLLAASSPSDEFVTKVSTIMAKFRGDIWEFLPSCSRAVAARFARDKQVRELAFCRLETQPTNFEKINFPSFLLQNDDQPERLRTWIRSEIKRQSEGKHLAEVALDLSTGTVRSVSHVLLEHLMA